VLGNTKSVGGTCEGGIHCYEELQAYKYNAPSTAAKRARLI
jgi:hypothetical protein